MDTPEHGYGVNGENGTPTTGSKNSAKLMRLRKPLREHATKIVVDLLRRDEVSSIRVEPKIAMASANHFSTICLDNLVRTGGVVLTIAGLTLTVDLESYPDYLGIVGGEDKMMDLGTMQNKIDNEEYRSIEEFQVGQLPICWVPY
jgi:hypothetical protein